MLSIQYHCKTSAVEMSTMGFDNVTLGFIFQYSSTEKLMFRVFRSVWRLLLLLRLLVCSGLYDAVLVCSENCLSWLRLCSRLFVNIQFCILTPWKNSKSHLVEYLIDVWRVSNNYPDHQDSLKNIGERPYVYKRSKPASMDVFELEYDFVHVRAFTYILSWVLANWYLQFWSYECRAYSEF